MSTYTTSQTTTSMKWYLAKVIFKITPGEGAGKSQFDEHLRLIAANSFEEAFLKSRMLGLKEEASFLNEQKQIVKWEFINTADLFPLNELTDGQELYSQIHETEEAKEYIHYVHQKAASMQLRHRPVF
jgi:Domain of unknown function (DUF4288)